MITAAQAREQTMERITQIAKEFITNSVESIIDEAIGKGKFRTAASFDGVIVNAPTETIVNIGKEVVRILTCDYGFEAEHIYRDGPSDRANYFLIRWGTN
jgi:hypothetical protein